MNLVDDSRIPAELRAAATDSLRRIASAASVEVMPSQVVAGLPIDRLLPPETRVYVPFLPDSDFRESIAAARLLREQGMQPVPHVPARAIRSPTELDEWLHGLTEAGVRSILLIAGDRDVAAGPYANTLELLASGRLADYAIRRIGIAGHPEGSPFATRGELDDALTIKREYAAQNGADIWIVTQFVFASARTIEWLRHVRSIAADLPIYIGLPGPARLSTLIAYAAQCGVSVSARVLKRRPGAARLLGRWTPDGLVRDLALHAAREPEAAMDGIHVYPFGGVARATEWLDSLRAVITDPRDAAGATSRELSS